jgi:hypothetical protein
MIGDTASRAVAGQEIGGFELASAVRDPPTPARYSAPGRGRTDKTYLNFANVFKKSQTIFDGALNNGDWTGLASAIVGVRIGNAGIGRMHFRSNRSFTFIPAQIAELREMIW